MAGNPEANFCGPDVSRSRAVDPLFNAPASARVFGTSVTNSVSLIPRGAQSPQCLRCRDLFARCHQAKLAGLLQRGECKVTIVILTDDDSAVHLIGTRAWIE